MSVGRCVEREGCRIPRPHHHTDEFVVSYIDEWWCPSEQRYTTCPGPCPNGSAHGPVRRVPTSGEKVVRGGIRRNQARMSYHRYPQKALDDGVDDALAWRCERCGAWKQPPNPPPPPRAQSDVPNPPPKDWGIGMDTARELYQLRYRNAGLEAVAEAAKALLDALKPYPKRVGVEPAREALRSAIAALEETRGTG